MQKKAAIKNFNNRFSNQVFMKINVQNKNRSYELFTFQTILFFNAFWPSDVHCFVGFTSYFMSMFRTIDYSSIVAFP